MEYEGKERENNERSRETDIMDTKIGRWEPYSKENMSSVYAIPRTAL